MWINPSTRHYKAEAIERCDFLLTDSVSNAEDNCSEIVPEEMLHCGITGRMGNDIAVMSESNLLE
jgi:hypothetical protein